MNTNTLGAVGVNVNIDKKTIIMFGIAVLVAVALGVIIGKRI